MRYNKTGGLLLSAVAIVGSLQLYGCNRQIREERRDSVEVINGLRVPGNVNLLPNLTYNSTRYRMAKRGSEKDGIYDMRRLIKTAPEEDAYIHLPEHDLWLEIGKDSVTKEIDTKIVSAVIMDQEYVKRLLGENEGKIRTLRMWHYHTEAFEKIALEKFLEIRKKQKLDEGRDEDNQRYVYKFHEFLVSVAAALPNQIDITASIFRNRMYLQEDDSIDYSEGICSSSGVVLIELTPKGKIKYRSAEDGDIFRDSRTIFENANPRDIKFPFEFINADSSTIRRARNGTITDFAEKMSTENIKVTFIPHGSE